MFNFIIVKSYLKVVDEERNIMQTKSFSHIKSVTRFGKFCKIKIEGGKKRG